MTNIFKAIAVLLFAGMTAGGSTEVEALRLSQVSLTGFRKRLPSWTGLQMPRTGATATRKRLEKARRRACRNLNTAVNKLGVRPTEKTVRETEKAAENLLNAMMEEQKAAEDILQDQLSKVDETQAVIEDAMATLNYVVSDDEMEKALRELQKEVDEEDV